MVIILDTFPTSSVAKRPGMTPSLSDQCRQWVEDCERSGHAVLVPAIAYYEARRELEQRQATSQIQRLRAYCLRPSRFIPLTTAHLEDASRLWGEARRAGLPTASPQALDGDVILATQALSLALPPADYSVVDIGSGTTILGIELANISPDVGIEWTGDVLTPNDFVFYSGVRQWNWTQLVVSQRKRLNSGVLENIVLNTTVPPTLVYGIECLDNSYPYGSPDANPPDGGFWYDADGMDYGSSDAPSQDFDGASVTEIDVLDSFHDYLMYLPPGSDSVVVPMKRVKWFWQGKGIQSGGVWTTSNKNSQWSFDGDFPDHPEWNIDILNDFSDFPQ